MDLSIDGTQRLRRCIGAACAIVLGFGGVGCDDRSEQEHFARNETPVFITAPEGVSVALLASGRDLNDARPAGRVVDPLWLPPGRWMVEADDGERRWHYPVTLTGFRSGPDREGAFIVSVRRPPADPTPGIPGMSFVPVPSGWFLFGDRRHPLESHFVWLSAYLVSVEEVRNAEFRSFLSAPDGWMSDDVWTAAGLAWRTGHGSASSATYGPGHPEHDRFGRDELPVTRVTWFEADAFARWATKAHGNGEWSFALPDEVEWEKVARGPDDLAYGLSEHVSDREMSLFNWKKNPGAEVTVVGPSFGAPPFRPNRYGILHLTGNVTEWTRSRSAPYSRSRPFRPDSRNDPEGTAQRVARGGSWYSASIALLAVSYRENFPPEHSTPELGFRLRAVRLPAPHR